ncbi:MAG: virulence factor [Candidatus Competibacteraceae bacterium]|nr:virulence factor [Candidatus Competibacteraceae bacterium]
MPKLITVYWRDIPAQVIVKQGRASARVQLADRFQVAIDRAAMRAGKGGSQAYLDDWRRSEPLECQGEPQEIARQEAARLEHAYGEALLERMVKAGGVLPVDASA